jgi:hypothetical protein
MYDFIPNPSMNELSNEYNYDYFEVKEAGYKGLGVFAKTYITSLLWELCL